MDPNQASNGAGTRLASLFSAVTSAMQPARLPIALLAVLFLSAMVPVIDRAGGKNFGGRGFAASALSESEDELAYQRARSAVSRVASLELQALEQDGRAEDGEPVPPRRLSLGELRGVVRDATRNRIDERRASEGGLDDFEERRLRERAATTMEILASAEPRGVATVFMEGERAAVKQVVNGLLRLDAEMFLAGTLGAVFSVPVAAVRQAPIIFPLALLVLLSAFAFLSGGLCRMAAVHAGRAARLTPREGADFARRQALSLIALPVLPAIVIGTLVVIILAFALLLRVPVLNILSGLLFVVPLLVALLAAVLAMIAIAGFPLMPAAVAVEDCDAGDAITRASALVLSRPLDWLAVVATSIVVLAVGVLLVNGVLSLASFGLTAALAPIGGEVGRALASGEASAIAALFGPDRIVGILLELWMGFFAMIGSAYAVSLACDLATRGYLLMRARIDGENIATISGYGIR